MRRIEKHPDQRVERRGKASDSIWAPALCEVNTPPSGVRPEGALTWLTLPVTLKVNTCPADSVRPGTRTGDSTGATSPELAVEPAGIPASHGSDVPGITTALAALAQSGIKDAAMARDLFMNVPQEFARPRTAL